MQYYFASICDMYNELECRVERIIEQQTREQMSGSKPRLYAHFSPRRLTLQTWKMIVGVITSNVGASQFRMRQNISAGYSCCKRRVRD